MKKEEKTETISTTKEATAASEPKVVIKEVIKEVVKEVPAKSTVKGIDQYTDEELLKELADRRARRAEIGAIHEVSVPIHELMKKSAVVPSDNESNQIRLQGELNHLQSKFNELSKGK